MYTSELDDYTTAGDSEASGVPSGTPQQSDADQEAAAAAALASCADGRSKARRWTASEHKRLEALVEKYGHSSNWTTIASHMPNRTGKQCRQRWVNTIRGADPVVKRAWQDEEETMVAEMHAVQGPSWSQIARSLPDRTENQVKNHWNTLWRSKFLHTRKGNVLASYVHLLKDGWQPCQDTLDAAKAKVAQHLALLQQAQQPQPQPAAAQRDVFHELAVAAVQCAQLVPPPQQSEPESRRKRQRQDGTASSQGATNTATEARPIEEEDRERPQKQQARVADAPDSEEDVLKLLMDTVDNAPLSTCTASGSAGAAAAAASTAPPSALTAALAASNTQLPAAAGLSSGNDTQLPTTTAGYDVNATPSFATATPLLQPFAAGYKDLSACMPMAAAATHLAVPSSGLVSSRWPEHCSQPAAATATLLHNHAAAQQQHWAAMHHSSTSLDTHGFTPSAAWDPLAEHVVQARRRAMLLLQKQAVEVSCLGSGMLSGQLGGDAGVCGGAGPTEQHLAAGMTAFGHGAMQRWSAAGNAIAAMPDAPRYPSESPLCGLAPFPMEAHLGSSNNYQHVNQRSFGHVCPTPADDSPLASLASAHSAAWASYHRATGQLGALAAQGVATYAAGSV